MKDFGRLVKRRFRIFLEGRFFKQDPAAHNNQEKGFVFGKSTQHMRDGGDFSLADTIEDFLQGSIDTLSLKILLVAHIIEASPIGMHHKFGTDHVARFLE